MSIECAVNIATLQRLGDEVADQPLVIDDRDLSRAGAGPSYVAGCLAPCPPAGCRDAGCATGLPTNRSGRGFLGSLRSLAGRVGHDATDLAQQRRPLGGPLHQHAAAIRRIDLAARQVELAQPIERTSDRRL